MEFIAMQYDWGQAYWKFYRRAGSFYVKGDFPELQLQFNKKKPQTKETHKTGRMI